jgi:hypothetical protein
MIEVHHSRKVLTGTYDLSIVKGRHADVSAAKPGDTEVLEKYHKEVNDGHWRLSFPKNYVGECFVIVEGSESGSRPDENFITVL